MDKKIPNIEFSLFTSYGFIPFSLASCRNSDIISNALGILSVSKSISVLVFIVMKTPPSDE